MLGVFSPMMSHSLMRPILSLPKFLMNHIDFLLTAESCVLKESLVVWSCTCFGVFSEGKRNNRQLSLIQSLNFTC